jgi:hypothetical protein
MPKPLELVVHDLASNAHLVAKSHPRSATARKKRLTDAELAAEVWCHETEFRAAMIRGDYPALDRLATIARFATHSHYDEESE